MKQEMRKKNKKKKFNEFINKTLTKMGIDSTLGISEDYRFPTNNFNEIFNILKNLMKVYNLTPPCNIYT